MSNSNVDSDGFQLVKTNKYSKNKNTKVPNKHNTITKQEVQIDLHKAKRSIINATEELQSSDYLLSVYTAVSSILPLDFVVEIVCFGLGHIGECVISRYQIALLLCLKDKFLAKNVFVHDPIFYKSECDILKSFNLSIIEENEEGHYAISKDTVTIVYLPHCPKQLTNNFLWCNWGIGLNKCILICNSFTSIIENQLDRVLIDSVPYIHKIFPCTQEINLVNNFKYSDIFNDISIHTFLKVDHLDKDFWNKGDKPQYENNEEFITSLMIDKLRI